MPTVAVLSAQITADTKDLESGLQRANQQVGAFGSGLSSVLSGIGAGIGMKLFDTLASGLAAAGEAAIGFNAKLEQSSIAFTSMLGSGEKAQEFLQGLQQFAKSTPFEYEGVEDAAKQMLAYGFNAKDVIPLLTDVGNASSALGAGTPGVDRITKALGQMSAATVVQRGELNQLTEMGVPAYEILGKAVGKSGQELNKLIEGGKISSKVFIDAFRAWSQEKFGDLMAQQSRTFSGALSNIGDAVKFATANAFKPLFTLLSEGAVALGDFLNSDAFTAWGASVQAAMQGVADAIRTGLEQAKVLWDTWIQPAVQTVAGWFAILQSQGLAPFLAKVGAWIVGAVPQIGAQFARWAESAVSWVEQALPKLGAAILSIVQGVTGWITQNAPMIALAFRVWGAALWQWVTTAGPQLLARLGAALTDLVTWVVNSAGIWASSLLTWATAFVSWVTPMIPQVLTALGGLITGIMSWIGQNSGAILAQLMQWAGTFWAWVQPAIPPLLAALATLGSQLTAWIKDTAGPAIVTQLATWTESFVNWALAATPPLMAELGTLAGQVSTWIVSTALPKYVEDLKGWGAAFADWVPPASEGMFEKLGQMAADIGTWNLTFLAALLKGREGWVKVFEDFPSEASKAMLKGFAQLFVDIANWLGRLPAVLMKAGRDAIDAFIRGFTSRSLPSISVSGGGSSGLQMQYRAAGGPVKAGQPYIVGEDGPEPFIPKTDGVILPNSSLTRGLAATVGFGGAGGGAPVTVIVNVYGHAMSSRQDISDFITHGLDIAQRQKRTRGPLV